MRKKDKEFTEKLHLPKDITQGAFILTAVGNQELYIENYKGIMEYTTGRICIQGKCTYIVIEGKNLVIDYYTEEDMLIKGCIVSIRYPV